MAPSKASISSSISAASPRDRDQEAAVVAEIDVALDQPQPLVLRALHIALAAAVGIGRDALIARDAAARDPTASATSVTSGLARSSRVTCQYQPDSGSSNSGSPSVWPVFSIGIVRRGEVGDQRLEIDAEAAVERALDRVAVERRTARSR